MQILKYCIIALKCDLGGVWMEHKKTYNKKEIQTSQGPLIIEGPVSGEQLESLKFHDGLVAFRVPDKQHKALIQKHLQIKQ